MGDISFDQQRLAFDDDLVQDDRTPKDNDKQDESFRWLAVNSFSVDDGKDLVISEKGNLKMC